MLLWTSLLWVFSAGLVTAQFFPPEVFIGYNPHTVLQPMNDGLEGKDSSDNVRTIRALLSVWQECPPGYAECTNLPGRLALQFPFFPLTRDHPFLCFTMTGTICRGYVQ